MARDAGRCSLHYREHGTRRGIAADEHRELRLVRRMGDG